MVFVVTRSNQLTTEDVVKLCRDQLAGYKIPKDVRFIANEDIPRSTSGKVKRHELERRLVEERI